MIPDCDSVSSAESFVLVVKHGRDQAELDARVGHLGAPVRGTCLLDDRPIEDPQVAREVLRIAEELRRAVCEGGPDFGPDEVDSITFTADRGAVRAWRRQTNPLKVVDCRDVKDAFGIHSQRLAQMLVAKMAEHTRNRIYGVTIKCWPATGVHEVIGNGTF